MNLNQEKFLNKYLCLLSKEEQNSIPKINFEYFCSDEYNANECARLVNDGIKKATCSLKEAYEKDNEPLPEVGNLMVVLDWNEEPICIIKLKEVSICRFNEVPPWFAKEEGEGDGSYKWWRDAHIKFFKEYSNSIGIEFKETLNLVLERFEKVYPK